MALCMSPDKSASALRTIGEVAAYLDVATHVLRFWETKFHQIKPQKRRGRRYYRTEDIDVIIKIKTLLRDRGYTIKGVHKFLAEEVKNKNTNIKDKANISLSVVASENIQTNYTISKINDSDNNEQKVKLEVTENQAQSNITNIESVGVKYSANDIAKLNMIYNSLVHARNILQNNRDV